MYFDFRIIDTADGYQVIDPSLKTPYSALTPMKMTEYMEVDAQLAIMEQIKRRAQREAGHSKRTGRNVLYRLACFCGIIQTDGNRVNGLE